jgi:hypothetical protein
LHHDALDALMAERGANTISRGEWVMETDSEDAICIYQGIASIVGNQAVVVKELNDEVAWDDVIVSQDLFFDLLKMR